MELEGIFSQRRGREHPWRDSGLEALKINWTLNGGMDEYGIYDHLIER